MRPFVCLSGGHIVTFKLRGTVGDLMPVGLGSSMDLPDGFDARIIIKNERRNHIDPVICCKLTER